MFQIFTDDHGRSGPESFRLDPQSSIAVLPDLAENPDAARELLNRRDTNGIVGPQPYNSGLSAFTQSLPEHDFMIHGYGRPGILMRQLACTLPELGVRTDAHNRGGVEFLFTVHHWGSFLQKLDPGTDLCLALLVGAPDLVEVGLHRDTGRDTSSGHKPYRLVMELSGEKFLTTRVVDEQHVDRRKFDEYSCGLERLEDSYAFRGPTEQSEHEAVTRQIVSDAIRPPFLKGEGRVRALNPHHVALWRLESDSLVHGVPPVLDRRYFLLLETRIDPPENMKPGEVTLTYTKQNAA